MIRDYTLNGETARLAVRDGIANPTWYRPKIDPKEILKLREKSDLIALRDTLIWLGLMALSCGVAIWLWPSWWSALFWIVYGVACPAPVPSLSAVSCIDQCLSVCPGR